MAPLQLVSDRSSSELQADRDEVTATAAAALRSLEGVMMPDDPLRRACKVLGAALDARVRTGRA